MLDELRRLSLYQQSNPNELLEEQFLKIKKEIEYPEPNTISDEYFDFLLWSNGYLSRQKSFANFIAKKLAKQQNMLLELVLLNKNHL